MKNFITILLFTFLSNAAFSQYPNQGEIVLPNQKNGKSILKELENTIHQPARQVLEFLKRPTTLEELKKLQGHDLKHAENILTEIERSFTLQNTNGQNIQTPANENVSNNRLTEDELIVVARIKQQLFKTAETKTLQNEIPPITSKTELEMIWRDEMENYRNDILLRVISEELSRQNNINTSETKEINLKVARYKTLKELLQEQIHRSGNIGSEKRKEKENSSNRTISEEIMRQLDENIAKEIQRIK